MRTVMLVAALALASCGGNQTTNNAAMAQGSSAEEVTAVNDVTAIDAATGQAANMAADVDYTFNEAEMNELSGDAAGNASANAAANNTL